MSMSPTTTTPTTPPGRVASRIAALRHRVDGDVLIPGDDGYDEAALAWTGPSPTSRRSSSWPTTSGTSSPP